MQIFPLLCGLAFHLLVKSSQAPKFFIFIKSPVYFFFCALGVLSKNPLPNSRSWRFTPVFSYEFYLSHLALRSVSRGFLCFIADKGLVLFPWCGRPAVPAPCAGDTVLPRLSVRGAQVKSPWTKVQRRSSRLRVLFHGRLSFRRGRSLRYCTAQ